MTGDFYWKGLADWIRDYVRSCDECQHSKSPRQAKYGLLQPLQVPSAAWSSISTDFITQLAESECKTQIIAVVDGFTKIAPFIALRKNATAKDVADNFLQEVWTLDGLPTKIISDIHVKLFAEFWESLCKMLGVTRRMSTAYHPQTDGKTETTNQVPESDLPTFVNYYLNESYKLLPLAEHVYTHSATTAHKMTLLFANHGFHPHREGIKEREAHNPGATMYAHWMQDIHPQAKQTRENTLESMKQYYDRKATKQPDIRVGDFVMLTGRNIRTKQPSKKLSPKLYGPGKVLEKKRSQGYKLEISARWKIHPLFDILLLEPYRAANQPARDNRSELLMTSKEI